MALLDVGFSKIDYCDLVYHKPLKSLPRSQLCHFVRCMWALLTCAHPRLCHLRAFQEISHIVRFDMVNPAWFQLPQNILRPEIAMAEPLSVQEVHPLGSLLRELVDKIMICPQYIRAPVDEFGSKNWHH